MALMLQQVAGTAAVASAPGIRSLSHAYTYQAMLDPAPP